MAALTLIAALLSSSSCALQTLQTRHQRHIAMPRAARLNAAPDAVALDRRAFLASAAASAAALTAAPANAALDPIKDRPNESLLLILRVKEAAAQEIRLIKTGKFKDLQRNSIKLAVNLMLNNYQLLENVNKASVLAKGRSFEALFTFSRSW